MTVSEEITVRAATTADLPAITALLAACELPQADIAPHLTNFLVAHAGGVLVGTIGTEVHGADALLRSLAVAPATRSHGLGRRLVQQLRVSRPSVRRWWLLTATAETFFAELRFGRVERRLAPLAIAATEEFRTLSPASAVCMVRREGTGP
jgi:amino-acid N-acetyltransferase